MKIFILLSLFYGCAAIKKIGKRSVALVVNEARVELEKETKQLCEGVIEKTKCPKVEKCPPPIPCPRIMKERICVSRGFLKGKKCYRVLEGE